MKRDGDRQKKQRGGKGGLAGLRRAAHDPRAAALSALFRVFCEGTDSQAAVDEALASPDLVPTDKRLCTELVYGALRWHPRLQCFAEGFLARPDKLPIEMRLSLVLALYEMAFLRIPHHASVNWAVAHVRNRFGAGLAGVANGALRSMQRSLGRFADPAWYRERFAEEDEASACMAGVPVWLFRLWMGAYGPEQTGALLEASQMPPLSGLRLNRARPGWERLREELLRSGAAPERPADPGVDDEGETAVPAPARPLVVGECCLAFPGTLPWRGRELVKEGAASRQSAASYEALEAFDPAAWPLPVWDCCAGRGGKTLALLERGVPVALASDPSQKRLAALGEEYARLGLASPPCPPALLLSAAERVESFQGVPPLHGASGGGPAQPAPEAFGTILVDAPCSGLGTLSRRPEIRLRRSPKDIADLVRLQRGILRSVWPRLLPGGRLVYLTCTLHPEENEGQTKAFLASHTDARLVSEFRTPFASPLREFFYGAALQKQ